MPVMTNDFHVGTIEDPTDLDSHVWRDRWTVNPINHWVASLGHNLTVAKAIHIHTIIILHELTHITSGLKHHNEKYDWDDFLSKIL